MSKGNIKARIAYDAIAMIAGIAAAAASMPLGGFAAIAVGAIGVSLSAFGGSMLGLDLNAIVTERRSGRRRDGDRNG